MSRVDEITASWDALLRQSWITAEDYMAHAVRSIDEQFGEGFSKKNPALVGIFMEVAAKDFRTAAMIVSVKDLCEAIRYVGRDEE